MPRPILIAAAIAALAVGAGLAAPPAAQEAVTVLAVEIPVQVVVDGKPVRGLTAENFELIEGRRPQPLTGFEAVDLAAGAAQPLPAAARRHFLLLFDLANAAPSAVLRAREVAAELTRSALQPADLVAVARYTHLRGAELVIGFTPDRAQVRAAIETLGLVEMSDRHRPPDDPLGLLAEDIERSAVGGEGGRGSEGLAILAEALKDLAKVGQAAERRDQNSRAVAFTTQLSALGRLLAAVQGRKQVVLFSEGFDTALLTGTTDETETAETQRAVEAGEIWKVDSEARFGSSRTQNQLAQLVEEFRRADCAIQAVDIGGLRAGNDVQPRPSGREALFAMAHDTGGQLFENHNDLGEAMNRLLDATSFTYVLTFQPDVKPDGKFHPVKVRLKNGPQGARLVHRPGYYAPRPWRERPALEQKLASAELLLGGESGGDLDAGAVVAAFRTATGRAHVPVVFEVQGPSVLEQGQGGRVALEFFAYAFDATGQLRDFVAQNVDLERAKVAGRLQSGSLKLAGDLLLPEGDYLVRLLVRAAETGGYWRGEVPLRVPGAEAVALLPPLFPEPVDQGLLARSATSAEKTKGLDFPFVLRGGFFMPGAAPRLSNGAPTEAVLVAYNLGAGELRIESDLMRPDGQPAGPVQVAVTERSAEERFGMQRLSLQLSPQGAAPGNYTLRVIVHQGEGRWESAAPVRIVS